VNGVHLLEEAEHYVAIDNVCAWPCVLRLPAGELVAAVYNKPAHGYGCGDVDLYVSSDDGRFWSRRSAISDHADAPEHVRMNHALGLNARGELVALVSGYHAGRALPFLPTQVCISADGGHTWQRSIWNQEPAERRVPFGPIILGPGPLLTAAIYDCDPATGVFQAYTIRSRDHGRTWGDRALLARGFNEVALLRLRDGRFIAAGRTPLDRAEFAIGTSERLHLLRSPDGRDWEVDPNPLTMQGQHPGHLLELQDGRLLLTYGSRIVGLHGVGARLSADGGRSWSLARLLVAAPGPMDCGYPSSVELPDGTIVTAYYAGPAYWVQDAVRHTMPWHRRYHMAVCRWRPGGFEFLTHPG